jgi:hypothetical protein
MSSSTNSSLNYNFRSAIGPVQVQVQVNNSGITFQERYGPIQASETYNPNTESISGSIGVTATSQEIFNYTSPLNSRGFLGLTLDENGNVALQASGSLTIPPSGTPDSNSSISTGVNWTLPLGNITDLQSLIPSNSPYLTPEGVVPTDNDGNPLDPVSFLGYLMSQPAQNSTGQETQNIYDSNNNIQETIVTDSSGALLSDTKYQYSLDGSSYTAISSDSDGQVTDTSFVSTNNSLGSYLASYVQSTDGQPVSKDDWYQEADSGQIESDTSYFDPTTGDLLTSR